jgi:hypothetical protein
MKLIVTLCAARLMLYRRRGARTVSFPAGAGDSPIVWFVK